MNKKITVGLDEAGRGPVLGPLVMAAIAVDDDAAQKLQWMGVKDSKLLSSERREELFERIRDVVLDFRVEVIEPDAIDLSLAESNLNWLEADTSARMVADMNPDIIVLDCPSVNIIAYRNYVLSKLPPSVKEKAQLIVEHKADMNYIAAAAASIVAKVIRDKYIENIRRETGVDCGSGYPSDPKTKKFLEEYHDIYPQYFRRKWKSYTNMITQKKQTNLGEYQ